MANGSLHERFLAVAAEDRDRVALLSSAGSSSMTYGQLADRALEIAGALRRDGAEDEELIGISLGRGLDRIAGVLGILCAGGAYVPLEPNRPSERLSRIVEDAAIERVLVDARTVEKVSPIAKRPVDVSKIEEARPTDLPRRVGPEGLAYVLYTSGSTGIPNGVEIEHGSVLTLVESIRALYEEHNLRRVMQFAGLGFDASVSEIFPTLLLGGSLWVLEQEPSEVMPEDLLGAACVAEVDAVNMPPSYLMAADERAVEEVPRVVILGGERCPPSLVARWASRTALYNFYGPTEVTVEATTWRCSVEDTVEVPIGRPLPHIEAEVISDSGSPADSATGELFLGGRALARGYLRRPELTAKRFREITLPGGRTQRMYATGDIVERRPDGVLIFIGRADRQIKLRGQRLEPRDVEVALRSYPGIEDAVVLSSGRDGLADRLVAFVTTRGNPPETAALRQHVAASRPAYMVPAEIVTVDSWPLTPNGKIDYADLERRLSHEAPPSQGNSLSVLISELWCELLEIDEVEGHTDFFEAGGDSLRAMRLISRLRRELGVEIAVDALHASPTADSFTDAIVTALGDGHESSKPRNEENESG